MGIKHFFIWFRKNYPDCIHTIQKNETNNIDNLCIDMNGIYHACAQKVFEYGDHKPYRKRLLKKVKRTSLKWQKKLYREICEKINFYLKLIKPKKRLILCVDGVAGMAKMNQQRQRRFKTSMADDGDMDFNPINITPGTKFMNFLSKYIDWYIRIMMSHDNDWQNIEVVFSNENVAGEGEHKIINYIRKYSEINESYCIHGLDADLIMLTLGTLHPHMYILRENHYNNNEKFLLDISNFGQQLTNNMKWEKTETSRRFSTKSVIDDFIFMCFLVGNDFVPTIPTLAILEGGIDVMIDVYKKVCPVYGHLTRCTKDSNDNVIVLLRSQSIHIFLGQLSMNEKGLLEEKQSKKDNFFPDEILNKNTKYIQQKHVVDFENYKKDYYDYKFKDCSIENTCHEYLIGLQWVITYYKRGIPDWSWFYKHSYAPFLCDLSKYSKKFKYNSFTQNTPVNPYIQLLCVLPPKYVNLLPQPLQSIIASPQSSVYESYPETCKIDLSGKRREWEGIVLLPNVDVEKIKKEYENVEDNIDKRDMYRIQNTNHISYKFVPRVSYLFKSFYGNISDCHCKRKIIEF